MDQLAPAIAWIKKNIFWLACGLLLVTMVALWFVTTNSLASAQKKNEQDVKSKITLAEGIRKKKPAGVEDATDVSHPNDATQQGMQEELEETFDAIVAAWRQRVADQKEILVWPDVIGNKQFQEIFAGFNPPEKFPEGAGTEVDALLGLYRLRILDHMNNLAGPDLLRSNWKDPREEAEETGSDDDRGPGGGRGGAAPGGGRGGALGGAGGLGAGGLGAGGLGAGGVGSGGTGGDGQETVAENLNKYAVIWKDVNQTMWASKLTVFQGRDDHTKESLNPTPLQCYMLQQDLWLLEAMFKIIREVNGDSNANDLSVIKEIHHIALGREAQGGAATAQLSEWDPRLAPKGTEIDGSAIAGGGGGEEEGGAPGPGSGSGGRGMQAPSGGGGRGMSAPGGGAGMGRGGGGMGRGGAGGGYNPDAAGFPPFHRRYVDLDFNPLTSEKILEVINANSLSEVPEQELELVIAKRVPFRIAVKMDERRIADFMAACANSPFAFEINQVRINKHDPNGEEIPIGGVNSDDGGIGAAGFSAGSGGGGIGIGDGPGGGGGGSSSQPVEVRTNFDVNVEFYGIVKIYNPVREDLLRQAIGLQPENTPENQPNANDAASVEAAREPKA